MRARRAAYVMMAFAAISVVHGVVARETHALHVVHVAFGAMYLVPTVAAALWIRPAAGVITALVAAVAYVLHARTAWAGDPMENANQYAMAAVFVFVACVCAALIHATDVERARRAASELRAESEAVVQAISSLSAALRSRDDGTAAHSERVAWIAEAVARRLGLPEERVEVVRLAGLVHDVGKIGVRDDVLLKPGALTPDERSRIERHPVIAAEILAPLRGGAELARIVVAHHEAPDGSGYPYHLTAERIPQEAALLRVADVYAALSERRPYKQELPPSRVLETMRAWTGKLDLGALEALEATIGMDVYDKNV